MEHRLQALGFRRTPLTGPHEDTGQAYQQRLERTVGVVYRAEAERDRHYFEASLPNQFDAVIHIDETRAAEPIEHTTAWDRGEVPETFPTGV